MVFVNLSPVHHSLAEESLGSDIIHHQHHRRLLLDQLSNLLVLPGQHHQVLKGEVHASIDTDGGADMPSEDAVNIEEIIEHLGVLV